MASNDRVECCDTIEAVSDAAEVTVVVTPVPDAPIADNLVITTPEDTAVNVVLAARDPDGDALTYAITTAPLHGLLSGTAPALRYTPNANYAGSDAFTYTASDGTLTSNPATVRIQVTPVNDAPVGNDRTIATQVGTPVTVTLTGSDLDGDALRFAIATPAQNGTITGVPPRVTYTPAQGYVGADSFTFTVFDGQVLSAPATVTLNVRLVNRPPTALPQTVVATEDTPIEILLAGLDPDGDPLELTITSPPGRGTLRGSGARYTYSPAADFAGMDAFTFTVSDGSYVSAPALVTLDVRGVNDAPTASDATLHTVEGTAIDITLQASDPDGDTLSFRLVAQPQHGSLTGSAPTLRYTPRARYTGTDRLTFTVSDGTLTSAVATLTLVVDPNPNNRAPTATAATLDTREDTALSITLTGSDPDGQALTFAIAAPPEHGTITGTPPNVTYTPALHFVGTDAFTFTTSDGALTSDAALVTVRVTARNNAPIATSQSLTTRADTPLSLTLTATDIDSPSLSFRVLDLPTHGALTGAPPNIVYTPAAGFAGADRLTFVASDGQLDSAPATITLTVTEVPSENHAPTASPQDTTVKSGETVSITLAGADADNDPLTFTLGAPPQHGLLDGEVPALSYTPSPGFVGTDTFTFTVSDGRARSAVAVVRIVVTPGDPTTGCGCTTSNPATGPTSGASLILVALFFYVLRRCRQTTLKGR